MVKGDYAGFRDLMFELASYYPSRRNDSPDQRINEWFERLQKFELKAIKKAVRRMPEITPEWHPSLGTLMTECKKISGNAAKSVDGETLQEKRDREYNRFLDTSPRNEEWQNEFVDQAPNKCEKLGRRWLIDAMIAGRRADSVISIELVKQRLAALEEAMKGEPKHVQKTCETSGRDEQGERVRTDDMGEYAGEGDGGGD